MLWKWVLKTFQIFNTVGCLRLTRCSSLFVCVVGGGSPSKEHNKKRTAEYKEVLDVEILAFSPERRWVAVTIDEALKSDWRAWWGQNSFNCDVVHQWTPHSAGSRASMLRSQPLCDHTTCLLILCRNCLSVCLCLSLIKRKTSDTT